LLGTGTPPPGEPLSGAPAVTLPGYIVNSPHAPVTITECDAKIDHRTGPPRLLPHVAYRNVSGKPIDGVNVSVTDLDAGDAEIVEGLYSNSDLGVGQATTSTWVASEFPPDVAAVRCTLRAVDFTDGTTWGTWPAHTAEARIRVIRPVPCGPPLHEAQPHVTLLEPRPGARGVDPKKVRVGLRSESPLIATVREIRFVPDDGDVVALSGYARLKPLFEGGLSAARFDGTITVESLRADTNYRVVVVAWDMQRSSARCAVTVERSLGAFTTGR
jgi:hypothetical protein